MVVYTCNPANWEIETGRQESEASLGKAKENLA
jgi:hypothetical protein